LWGKKKEKRRRSTRVKRGEREGKEMKIEGYSTRRDWKFLRGHLSNLNE